MIPFHRGPPFSVLYHLPSDFCPLPHALVAFSFVLSWTAYTFVKIKDLTPISKEYIEYFEDYKLSLSKRSVDPAHRGRPAISGRQNNSFRLGTTYGK